MGARVVRTPIGCVDADEIDQRSIVNLQAHQSHIRYTQVPKAENHVFPLHSSRATKSDIIISFRRLKGVT